MQGLNDYDTRLRWLLAVGLLGSSACGAGDGSQPGEPFNAVQFEAEQALLPALDFDSGWLPEDSPASIRATASASGGITTRVQATPADGMLAAVPGSGKLTVEGGIDLELSARIDTAGVSYEGVVESFRYAIEPQSAGFDTLLVDDSISLTAELPAQDLGSVPIPSVPGGSLALEVTGGEIDTKFAGTCAEVSGEVAQVTGVLETSGTVECAASIVIDVPIVGEQSFGPFAFTIAIPQTTTDVDLGLRSLATGEVTDGNALCGDTAAVDDDDDDDDDDDGSTDDGEGTDDGTGTDGGTDGSTDGSTDGGPVDGKACWAQNTCNDCVACASVSGGECFYEAEVCELNPECTQLSQCQNECSALPTQQSQWCTIGCLDAHPDGIDPYLALATCLADVCDTQCVGG